MVNTSKPKSINSNIASNFKGYHQSQASGIDETIALIEPGTPCGEFFRRYWHPVALSSEIGSVPLPVNILGENLVLFRTSQGELGLVHKHCPHRRASLIFGKCEEHGIRCCYHGWLFSTNGEFSCQNQGFLHSYN